MISKVVGVKFKNEEDGTDRQKIIRSLSGKEKVFLKREPWNRFDKNAIAVVIKKGKSEEYKIGYLTSELAGILADFWKEYKYSAHLTSITDGDLQTGRAWSVTIEIKKIRRKKKDA